MRRDWERGLGWAGSEPCLMLGSREVGFVEVDAGTEGSELWPSLQVGGHVVVFSALSGDSLAAAARILALLRASEPKAPLWLVGTSYHLPPSHRIPDSGPSELPIAGLD